MGEETANETQETVDTLPVPKPEEAVKREGKYSIQHFSLKCIQYLYLFINQEYIISIKLVQNIFFVVSVSNEKKSIYIHIYNIKRIVFLSR